MEISVKETFCDAIRSYHKSISATPQMVKALENFATKGFPSNKNGAWKFTRIEKKLPTEIQCAAIAAPLASEDFSELLFEKGYKIVLTNGKLNNDLISLPDSVELTTSFKHAEMEPSTNDDDIFNDLNFAAMSQYIGIKIKKDSILDSPISIIHQDNKTLEGTLVSPRIEIVAEKFSKCEFVEFFNNSQSSLVRNSIVEVKVEAGANLTHIKVQQENLESTHIGKVSAKIDKDAVFHSFTMALGSKLNRNEINVALNHPGGKTSVDGIYFSRDHQHIDNFSVIHHSKEHTESEQLFKGILDDNSRGIFTGKIIVHKDAQKVNSNQLSRNLLLSKKAKVETSPELEVYADDVKCAHGATVGQMSENEIFYLESRGIPKEKAKIFLQHAFAEEVIIKVNNPEIVQKLEKIFFESAKKLIQEENQGEANDKIN